MKWSKNSLHSNEVAGQKHSALQGSSCQIQEQILRQPLLSWAGSFSWVFHWLVYAYLASPLKRPDFNLSLRRFVLSNRKQENLKWYLSSLRPHYNQMHNLASCVIIEGNTMISLWLPRKKHWVLSLLQWFDPRKMVTTSMVDGVNSLIHQYAMW